VLIVNTLPSRKFLSVFLIGFNRKFIPQFSDISVPLTDLTKKNVPNKVKWSDTTQKAFDKLKDCICSDSVSTNFRLDLGTIQIELTIIYSDRINYSV
jgi:hypothetical protein